MAKLLILANQPIRMDRDVNGNEVLATIDTEHDVATLLQMLHSSAAEVLQTIDTEHSVATLLMMLQQRQARMIVEGEESVEETASVSEEDLIPKTFAETLSLGGISDKQISLLANANVTNLAQAALYLAEHDNSFEPIKGIGAATSQKLIAMLT